MDESRPGRQLAVWAMVAVAATALLLVVLRWERRTAATRWSPLLVGSAREGAEVFARKGCATCHDGSSPGGSSRARVSGPGELVASMWNHAPRMWARMREQRVVPAAISPAEMANVFAYLYTARTLDGPGDAAKGKDLLSAKGCSTCHAPGAGSAQDLSRMARLDSPIAWASAIWNHPEKDGPPVTFAGSEMNDLVTFVRGGRERSLDGELLAADADRGWRIFREKSCAACHGTADPGGRPAPDLGRDLPPTLLTLAGSMWNHGAAMQEAMKERGIKRPLLDRQEMADMVAFLYSVRYSEPGGAPKAGEVLYEGRGCDRCHGSQARGTREGPALRGRGRRFSAIALAATLWRHGPGMYRQTRELGVGWPTLTEGNVGDLIAFLNTPPPDVR